MSRNAETSAKAERDQLRDRMRGMGCSAPQIAAEMARRFNLRPRLAWRHALGWPQWKLAQRYNTAHPGAKLSESRISEYESWPHGGSPPSLRYLARLAATYGNGCTPAHLVDADDLEHLNPADRRLLTSAPPTHLTETLESPTSARPKRRGAKSTALPAGQAGDTPGIPGDLVGWAAAFGLTKPGELAVLLATCLGASGPFDCDALAMPWEHDRAYHQLVQFLTSWAHTVKRRAMLRTLGWAATAASVGYSLDLDEQARVGSVFNNAARLDAQTIGHLDTVLWHCKRQDDMLGPRGVLDTVLAQRELARSLLPQSPAPLRPQLLSTLGNASRLAGWFSFNLNDFASAVYYHNDARAHAHEAENVELGALVLAEMGTVAARRGTPRTGIDHAVASCEWANRTQDRRLRALCADGAALAYAVNGQRKACLGALDTAQAEVDEIDDQTPGYSWTRYGAEAHISECSNCHLELRDAGRAAEYAQHSLELMNLEFTRRVALRTVVLGRARAQSNDIDEAARLFGDAAEIAAQNSSIRLIEVLKQARTELRPWRHTTAVRALDDRLNSHGFVFA
jgi:hypothetical protein